MPSLMQYLKVLLAVGMILPNTPALAGGFVTHANLQELTRIKAQAGDLGMRLKRTEYSMQKNIQMAQTTTDDGNDRLDQIAGKDFRIINCEEFY